MTLTPPTSLADVPVGEEATVQHIGCDRATSRRLMELGLIPKTRILVSRVAPMGCPVELRVRGAQLSIRRSDAALIEVATQ